MAKASDQLTIVLPHGRRTTQGQPGIAARPLPRASTYLDNIDANCVLRLVAVRSPKFQDFSDQRNHASVSGPAMNSKGRFGPAWSIAGGTDYVQVSRDTKFEEKAGSVVIWLKPTTAYPQVAEDYLVTTQEDNGLTIAFQTSGKLRFRLYNGGSDTLESTTTSFATSRWYCIGASWDKASGMKLFVNGAKEAYNSSTRFPSTGLDNDTFIGAKNSSGDNAADILVDEVMIFRRALSDREFAEIYAAGL